MGMLIKQMGIHEEGYRFSHDPDFIYDDIPTP
jgi:hypothetical protein